MNPLIIVAAVCLAAGFGLGRISGRKISAELHALEAKADADLKAAIEKVKKALHL